MKRKRPPSNPLLVEGRRLMQRMLTLHLAGKHDEATAQIFQSGITDVKVILAALELSVRGWAHTLNAAVPDEDLLQELLHDWFLTLEGSA